MRCPFLGGTAALPELAMIKDLFRFYIHTSQPRLDESTTADSMGTIAEWFFAGFTRATGTVVLKDIRSEAYNVEPTSPELPRRFC